MSRGKRIRIAVVAPSNQMPTEVPERVLALAAQRYGEDAPDIVFHPQCFLSHGHFAGTDAQRSDALVEVANDPSFDAVWMARGGYGACRIVAPSIARFARAARAKTFLGYSDAGFLLAGLDRHGIGKPVHGSMPSDIRRQGGDAAVARSLDWLTGRALTGHFYFGDAGPRGPVVALNLSILVALLGTPLMPALAGRVVMVEEVSEEMYRIDRMLFTLTSHPAMAKAAGLMLGRCAIKPNVDGPDWGVTTEEDIARYWCDRNNIPWLGRADIGHDAGNQVVPWG